MSDFAVGAVPMIAIIGESHADPMIGAFVHDPHTGAPLAFASYSYIPALCAGYFLDGEGRVNPKIVGALCMQRLLISCTIDHPEAIPQHIMGPNFYLPEGSHSWRLNKTLKDTPLLFMAGEVDARHVFRAIPPHADVPVPFRTEQTERIPTFEATAMIGEESLRVCIATMLAPMFRAIALLRDVGFTTIALHSISPPTADDAQYLHEIKHDTRALTRYKVIMLFNAALAQHCRDNDFLFVDRWSDFTDGGVRRDGIGSDAIHIAGPQMRTSLQRLYEMTSAQRSGAWSFYY